jgi:hypothetical protein
MAPTPQLRTMEISPSAAAYRPVSVLAIVGFTIPVVLGIVLVGSAAAAFVRGAPLLDPWILPFSTILSVVGIVLSLLAWWQIRQSEGTRAGAALAKWGWWLSLLFGLGYLAYYFAFEAALGLEATDFTDKWFAKLREGDVNSAFLLTLDPDRRKDLLPNRPDHMAQFTLVGEQGMSELQSFEEKEFVRFLIQGGTAGEVQSQGVREWRYLSEPKAYQVQLSYRLRAPEGEMDCLITVKSGSSRGKKSGGRQWYIVMPETNRAGFAKPSDLGIAIEAWSNQAGGFAEGWLGKLAKGDIWEAYLDTLEPSERERLGHEFASWKQLHSMAWTAGVLAGGPACASALPVSVLLSAAGPANVEGYRRFAQGSFIGGQEAFLARGEGQKPEDKAQREETLRALVSLFRPQPGEYSLKHPAAPAPMTRRMGRLAMWKKGPNDRLQLTHTYQIYAFHKASGLQQPPKYRYDVRLELESDTGPVTIDRKPEWRLAAVTLLEAGDMKFPSMRGRPGPNDGAAPPEPPLELRR